MDSRQAQPVPEMRMAQKVEFWNTVGDGRSPLAMRSATSSSSFMLGSMPVIGGGAKGRLDGFYKVR